MILYKYMKAKDAISTLRDGAIKMAKISSFNDPFEGLAALTYDPSDRVRYISSRENFLLSSCREDAFVYCLTRNPLNPLMWAHYADQHKGIVLGIKVDTQFFSNVDKCILPIQEGGVIYAEIKPFHDYPMPGKMPANFICPKCYEPQNLERLQRVFLYKSRDWEYEDEVRVVKHKSQLPLARKQKPSDPWRMVHVPDLSICEIYLGCRTEARDMDEIRQLAPHISLKRCRTSTRTWSLAPDLQMGF